MNYNSFLPTNYKKGLIDTLLCRPYNICADYSILHNEIKYLKNYLAEKFVSIDNCNCIKIFLDKLFITTKSSNTISYKKEIFICLEFLVKISLQSKKTVDRYI